MLYQICATQYHSRDQLVDKLKYYLGLEVLKVSEMDHRGWLEVFHDLLTVLGNSGTDLTNIWTILCLGLSGYQ